MRKDEFEYLPNTNLLGTEKTLPIVGTKPNRPNQVFGYPGDGVKLNFFNLNSEIWALGTTIRQLDDGWMEVQVRDYVTKKSMADSGMVPNDDGRWNLVNWCEVAE